MLKVKYLHVKIERFYSFPGQIRLLPLILFFA